jgi:hypothetical protein
VTVFLGDKSRLAVEVGDWDGTAVRRVDMWAAGQRLTCDDNAAYVPQFRRAIAGTADWLRSGGGGPSLGDLPAAAAHRQLLAGRRREEVDDELWSLYSFSDSWVEITDNVSAFLFRDGERLEITFEFWREAHLLAHPEHLGTVFTIEIEAAELVQILDELAAVLDHDGEQHAGT